MVFDVKWTVSKDGRYHTECSSLTVYEQGGDVMMIDEIEQEGFIFPCLEEAMKIAGIRFLTVKLGQFAPFMKSMEKVGELEINHVLVNPKPTPNDYLP